MPNQVRHVVEQGVYEEILVPFDGSTGSRRGIDRALTIADRCHATIHVLHVVDDRVVGTTPALSSDELALEKHHERGKRLLESIAAEATQRGVETTSTCVRGVPDEEIRRYVESHKVDLIVMGVHGKSDRSHPHPGGTTDRVMQTATVPVLPV